MIRRIFVVSVLLAASVCMHAQNLTILHVNDTHSHIDPERSGKNAGRGGCIEQSAIVDSVRRADGKRNVLLLHAGDNGQGTSYFTELNGNIEIDILNSMGFDVVCLGNHEFDNGVDELARRLANLKAEVVCSNYDFSSSVLGRYVKPYTIVRKAGKKIGIIGLLTDIRSVVDKDIALEFKYSEPAPVVNELAAFLKNEKSCDLVICLTHIGYEEDVELASQIRNVDIIVGGHSHTLLDDKKEVSDLDGNPVVIVHNWKWGLNLGQLSVRF